uniref:TruB pseudouridine (psi) synthase family member 2 n=1 Tax=Oncorhynchus tshawytscha TaxID=74940 RepID=A0A8C8EGQ2_ONCTS
FPHSHISMLQGLFMEDKRLVPQLITATELSRINAAPPTAHHQRVQFLAEPISVVAEGSSELTLSAASVPLLAHHPLVSGPEFQYIRAAVGHRLDAFSSGVLDGTFFVGQANKALTDLYRSHVTRGEFGMATDFSHTGRLIERTTYGSYSAFFFCLPPY